MVTFREDIPFRVRDRRRQGFFTIDNEIYDDYGEELGPFGLSVYGALARFANQESECWPSLATLAKRTGMSRRQVIREIAHLEALGLIAIEKQINPETGEHKANLYILLSVKPPAREAGVINTASPGGDSLSPGSDTQSSGGSDTQTPGGDSLSPKQNTENNTQREENIKQQGPSVSDERGEADPVAEDVVVVLVNDLGISESVARSWMKQYNLARIQEKIDYLAFLQETDPEKVKNPCGWLRKAVEEDWAAPAGYKTPEERSKEQTERERLQKEQEDHEQAVREVQERARQAQQAQEQEQQTQLYQEYGTTEQERVTWEQVKEDLKYLGAGNLDMLREHYLLKIEDGIARIGTTNHVAHDFLRLRLIEPVRRTLERILDTAISIEPVLI